MPVLEELRRVIAEIKDIPEDSISMESNFVDDLEADSLDVIEMLMQLEEKYDLIIPEDIIANMKKVKEVVEYIEMAIKEKK